MHFDYVMHAMVFVLSICCENLYTIHAHCILSYIDMKNVTLSTFTGTDSLLAAIIVAYILPNPRTKEDHSRIVRIVTVSIFS